MISNRWKASTMFFNSIIYILSIARPKFWSEDKLIVSQANKIVDWIFFVPVVRLARLVGKELVVFNKEWNYYFIVSDYISYKIMMLTHEGYVPVYLFHLVRRFKEKPIFIDVGAHQGCYSLALYPYCRLIVAIEPDALNYHFLKSNLMINNVKNCITVNCAAGSFNGFAELHISELSGYHTIKKGRGCLFRKRGRVPVYSLDTLLLDKLLIDRIDLVKIDVEGAEADVLMGMRKIIERFKPVILIEVFRVNYEAVIEYLHSFKYRYKVVSVRKDPLYGEYRYLLAYY